MNANTSTCNYCGLSTIYEEPHECPLRGITFVGYVMINGSWYIGSVAKGKGLAIEWTNIKPLPISRLLTSDEFLQRDKKGRNQTETGQNLCSHKTKISLVISLAI